MLLYMLGPPLPVPRNQAGALQKSDYSTWVYSYAVLTLPGGPLVHFLHQSFPLFFFSFSVLSFYFFPFWLFVSWL